MKRDIITIIGKEVSATGQYIWMSAVEIAELFNVTAVSVNNAIRSILKNDTLNDYEVCRCVLVGNCASVDVYNLELIIPLAYRFEPTTRTCSANGLCGGQRQSQRNNRR